jgi:hypothetical protein
MVIVIIFIIEAFLIMSLFSINKSKNDNIKQLEKDFDYEITKLQRDIHFLKNPIIFQNSDILWYYDEEICDKPLKCTCRGISKYSTLDDLEREYFVEFPDGIRNVSEIHLSTKKEDF